MKVALVTCFNANWFLGRIPSPYIPLNLLLLGTYLRDNGHQVEIIDQTLALLQGKATDGPEFYRQIADLIYATQSDVVGFTTMCNSYPQTLSLARHYREIDSQAKIILGGPQATVTDVPTLESFPWIDAIVRGEADHSLPELVNRWDNALSLQGLLGITWRDNSGQLHRNEDASLIHDIDELPFPAFDLYPVDQINAELVAVDSIPIEAGRGCPYGCTYCSTSRFFHRRHRVKSPERLIAEMAWAHKIHGFLDFELVHDILTVDRRWMLKFCQTLLDDDHPFKWSCSGRIDRVDEELLARMAEAGCTGIYFGVETGSQRMQSVIKKKLELERVLPTMRTCLTHGLSPVASFIIGFPEETKADMLNSFDLALDIAAVSPKTITQMHLLSPLIGSPLYEEHKDTLQFDGHSSDFSLFPLADEEVEIVRNYPEIFSNFYYIPTPELDRDLTKATSAALYSCANLFIALRYAGLNTGDVLDGWIKWQRKHIGKGEIGRDYYLYRFGLDMCRYLRTEVVDLVAATAPFLGDMVNYFETKYALQRGHILERTLFRQFEYDVRDLNQVLRADTPRSVIIDPTPTDLLFVNLAFNPERGYVFLEVQVPRTENPVIRPGDELEVRNPVKQLQMRPNLIIRNNTQKRVFATKHHMTNRTLMEMGLPLAAQ